MDKKTILIADDAEEVRRFVEIILGKEGFNVIEAENGEEAVEQAVEKQPDLVLMDIMMPEMDGIQATAKIKNHPKTAHIPVVMLTALLDSDVVLQSYDYGADHYIDKPLDKSKILKGIDMVMKMDERGI